MAAFFGIQTAYERKILICRLLVDDIFWSQNHVRKILENNEKRFEYKIESKFTKLIRQEDKLRTFTLIFAIYILYCNTYLILITYYIYFVKQIIINNLYINNKTIVSKLINLIVSEFISQNLLQK